MAEGFAVGTELTFSTNMTSVLSQILKDMQSLGSLTEETQAEVAQLEKDLREMGGAAGGIADVVAEMKALNEAAGPGGGFVAGMEDGARAAKQTTTSIQEATASLGQAAKLSREAAEADEERIKTAKAQMREDRMNAEWMNSDARLREQHTRQSADYQKADRDANRAAIRRQAEDEEQARQSNYVSMRKQADEENAARDGAYDRLRREAEMEEQNRQAAYEGMRQKADLDNSLFSQQVKHQEELAALREKTYGKEAAFNHEHGEFDIPPMPGGGGGKKGGGGHASEAALVAGAAGGGRRGGHGGRGYLRSYEFERDGTMAAMGLGAMGGGIMDLLREMAMARGDYDHQMAMISNNRSLTQADMQGIDDTVHKVTSAVPGSTLTGNTEIFGDMMTKFSNVGEIKENLEAFSHLITTFQMIDLKKGGSGDFKQAFALANYVEDQGGATDPKTGKIDPKKYAQIAQAMMKVAVFSRGTEMPSDYLNFQKQAKEAGMFLNDHASFEELPYFLGSMGSQKLGTAMFGNMQTMIAGRLMEKHEKELEDIGVMPKGTGHEVKDPKTHKSRFVYEATKLVGYEMAKHDPFQWVHDTLAPAIANFLHVDPNTKEGVEAIAVEMTKMAQRGNIAGEWVEFFRNYQNAQRVGVSIDQQGDFLGHAMSEDELVQFAAMKNAFQDFLTEAGGPMMGAVTAGLREITASLKSAGEWIRANPDDALRLEKAAFYLAAAELAMSGFILALMPLKGMLNMLAAAAAFAKGMGAETAVIESQFLSLRNALKLGVAGYVGNAAVSAVDPKDKTGAYIDHYVPGASFVDNLASHVGLGRSYAEQKEIDRSMWGSRPGDIASAPVSVSIAPSYGTADRVSIGGAGPDPAQPMHMTGAVNLDGHQVGTFVASTHADQATLPQAGTTGPNLRMNVFPAGTAMPGF